MTHLIHSIATLNIWLCLNIIALYDGIFNNNIFSCAIPIGTIILLTACKNVSSQKQFEKYLNAYYGLCVLCLFRWILKYPLHIILEGIVFVGTPLVMHKLKIEYNVQ